MAITEAGVLDAAYIQGVTADVRMVTTGFPKVANAGIIYNCPQDETNVAITMNVV